MCGGLRGNAAFSAEEVFTGYKKRWGIETLYQYLKNKENSKELLTEEMVELLTAPADLAGYKAAITEALYKGTKRNIESETDTKNAQVG